MQQPSKQQSDNQAGFVSIMVTLIIMAIITITVISFALLMRREQRQALDRQLSAQAFYAAESGVNDAAAYLSDTNNGDKTNCDGFDGISSDIDSSSGVAYTCVLINKAPDNITVNPVSDHETSVMKLQLNDLSPTKRISKIVISWQDSVPPEPPVFANNERHFLPTVGSGDGAVAQNNTRFPVAGGTILRTSIIPVSRNEAGNTDTRANLTRNQQTMFLYPKASATPGQIPIRSYFNPLNPAEYKEQVKFADGACHANNNTPTTPRHCNVEIDNLEQFDTNIMYLSMRAIYRPASVIVRVYEGSDSGGAVVQSRLRGYQALVDSTGKANDVLRRIEVRLPLDTSQFYFPDFALESMDTICKVLLLDHQGAKVEQPQSATFGDINSNAAPNLDPTRVCQTSN